MPLTAADFETAVLQHLSHGAMTGTDPLVDSLYGQLEAPAAEGAQAHCTAGAGLTAEQRTALAEADETGPALWLLALVAVACCAASALWPLGFAA